MKLLKKVNYNKADDTLVFVGDYIDRGKNSFEVVSFLISLQKEVGEENCICLKGNHEQMVIDHADYWKSNGGNKTLKSFYRNGKRISDYVWWFKKLPLIYDVEEIVFCHAGLPKYKIEDNTQDDILWDREWLSRNLETEKQVVFGHTPSTQLAFVAKNGNIGIDAGCVFGYQLCAMVLADGEPAHFVYENKSDKD